MLPLPDSVRDRITPPVWRMHALRGRGQCGGLLLFLPPELRSRIGTPLGMTSALLREMAYPIQKKKKMIPHFPRDQPHGICGAGRGCLHRFEPQLSYHEAATEETEWHRRGRRSLVVPGQQIGPHPHQATDLSLERYPHQPSERQLCQQSVSGNRPQLQRQRKPHPLATARVAPGPTRHDDHGAGFSHPLDGQQVGSCHPARPLYGAQSNQESGRPLVQTRTSSCPNPTMRSEIRVFSHAANQLEFKEGNLYQGHIPDRLVVGLLHTLSYHGDVAYPPFSFQKFGLSQIQQLVRGEVYPASALELNHNNTHKDLEGYSCFLVASEAWRKGQASMVEPEMWGGAGCCTLFMFDNVTNGASDSTLMNPRQDGDLRIRFKLGAAVNHVNGNGAVIYNIYRS